MNIMVNARKAESLVRRSVMNEPDEALSSSTLASTDDQLAEVTSTRQVMRRELDLSFAAIFEITWD